MLSGKSSRAAPSIRHSRTCWSLTDSTSIPKVTAHYADVSDPVSVENCINEIIDTHGKIDNLVTSAGFTENFEAVNYPIDRMRKLWSVNVDGTYLLRHRLPVTSWPGRALEAWSSLAACPVLSSMCLSLRRKFISLLKASSGAKEHFD